MLLKNSFNTGVFFEDFRIERLKTIAAHHYMLYLSLASFVIIQPTQNIFTLQC